MTPDVNVLLAAARPGHPHHAVGRTWLDGAQSACERGQPLVLLPMVVASFLRLITNPRVFAEPSTTNSALGFLRTLLAEPSVRLVGLGPEWPLLASLCDEHQLAGNAVSDAWIAAAVQAHGEHLVTFDRGFRRYLSPSALTILQP